MKKLEVIYKNTDELIPYVNNPRFNEGAVDAVASSIKNFGFKQPIVIDDKNEIIAGHTRLLASKKLGLEEVPVIIADDLNEGQIRAYRLADNKVGEFAEWDYDLLELELEDIETDDLDIDMEEFGFEVSINNEVDWDDYEETELKEDNSNLKKCPNCGCEFEV
ncbi:MAG: ParB N-terminal domain-containing protein [Anaerococcus sp.]|nr:ParB N-terminal domain-containing protein [Anaerococcus sp.]